MLEAAARFRDHVEEDVPVVRQEAPEAAIFLDDRLEILRRAGAVEDAALADVDQGMLLPVNLEVVYRGIADHDR